MSPLFQAVSEAYEVLGDEDKRKQYDNFGTAGKGTNSRYYNFAIWYLKIISIVQPK